MAKQHISHLIDQRIFFSQKQALSSDSYTGYYKINRHIIGLIVSKYSVHSTNIDFVYDCVNRGKVVMC